MLTRSDALRIKLDVAGSVACLLIATVLAILLAPAWLAIWGVKKLAGYDGG